MALANLLVLSGLAGCAAPLPQRLQAYWHARETGDIETVGRFLASDARIWFHEREGTGAPLRPEGGPWADWDDYFRATHVREDVQVDGSVVTCVDTESNDFYRLIDRAPTRARMTYWFDDAGRINGMLYAPLDEPRPPDRLAQFKAWARRHHPGALDSLMPEGRIVPDLERARRWKEMLTAWRAAEGLPPIEP